MSLSIVNQNANAGLTQLLARPAPVQPAAKPATPAPQLSNYNVLSQASVSALAIANHQAGANPVLNLLVY